MAFDYNFINRCQHFLIQEELNIVPMNDDGTILKATLAFPTIKNKALTFIRSYNDEQEFVNSNTSYLEDINPSTQQLPNVPDSQLPIAGVIKKIGITDYDFSDSQTIIFTKVSDDRPFPDVNPDIFPPNRYLIDYYVAEGQCPLCEGSGYVRDIAVDGTGDIIVAEETQKLIQHVLKTLLTQIGNSPEDFSYGSGLEELVGSEIDMGTAITLQKNIQDAVLYMIQDQEGKTLTAKEMCTGLSKIEVNEDEINPGKLKITVYVLDGNGKEQPATLVFDTTKGIVTPR